MKQVLPAKRRASARVYTLGYVVIHIKPSRLLHIVQKHTRTTLDSTWWLSVPIVV